MRLRRRRCLRILDAQDDTGAVQPMNKKIGTDGAPRLDQLDQLDQLTELNQ